MRISLQADEPEMHQFVDLRRLVVQHAAEFRRSRCGTNTDDRQVATTIVTVEFKEDRIAGFTVNPDVRLGTWRSAWPSSSRLDARLLAYRWPRMVPFVGRPSIQCLVRAVLIVPIDDESHFTLEIRLVFGHCD